MDLETAAERRVDGGAPATPDTRPGAGLAALAGVAAAGVALAIGELLAAVLPGVGSPVVTVANAVVDLAPGPLQRLAINLLGTADKPALLIGIVVVVAGLGGLLGVLGARRLSFAAAGFGLFALLGVAAAATDPQAAVPLTALALAVAALAAVGALARLLAVAPRPSDGAVAAGQRDRRSFLRAVAVTAVAAGGTGWLGRWLEQRSEVAAARRAVSLPAAARTAAAPPAGADLGIDGLASYVTPNADFYRIDTALSVPRVDPVTWRLGVTGMVDRRVELSYDDLLGMAETEHWTTLCCVSNEVGGSLIGNARWQGVPLRDVLDLAGVQLGADQLVGRSVDGWTAGFPTELAFDGRTALIAVGMNGEPLPVEHGFPARLVVPGLYGYVSATKWLSELELTTWDAFDAYWVPRGWGKEGPVKTQSRIDTPRPRAALAAGTVPVAGVAWAQHRGVERVEVQVDDGPWAEAELAATVNVDTWRQWVYRWDAAPGPHTLRVRATDSDGETQTAERQGVVPDGATGHHTVPVTVS